MRPTSLGENENIIVTISRKEIRLSKINALSISDIIAQAEASALPWVKTSYRSVAIWMAAK